MPVLPKRLLPSVIVGALVTGALALGAGTASAAPSTCKSSDGVDFIASSLESLTGICLLDGLEATADRLKAAGAKTLAEYQAELEEEAEQAQRDEEAAQAERDAAAAQAERDAAAAQDAADEQAERDAAVARERQRLEAQRAADQRAEQEAAQREAALTAQRAAQAQAVAPNPNLLSPGGAYGGLAATTPALGFGFGTIDPSLLLAPAGSPLRTLTGIDQGSPVTTVSDVQAMAFDNMPGGLGMPAVTGTLILSAFAAFALRHRVLRRARTAADAGADTGSEADTAEIPAREPVG